MIRIGPQLSIPDEEITFETSRSPGPGGQNVNKVETRVTLLFDVAASPSLTEAQRRRIERHLDTRINREGVLRVTSSRHRSQIANRRAATERFVELLQAALRPRKRRKKTRPTRSSVERRLKEKARRGEVKRRRRPPGEAD